MSRNKNNRNASSNKLSVGQLPASPTGEQAEDGNPSEGEKADVKESVTSVIVDAALNETPSVQAEQDEKELDPDIEALVAYFAERGEKLTPDVVLAALSCRDQEIEELKQKSESPAIAPTSRTIRALREICVRLGLPIKSVLRAGEAPEQALSVIEQPGTVQQLWAFDGEYVGEGPASAVDTEGNWSAIVFNDGSAEIIRYASPNLYNRTPGTRIAGDQVLSFPSLSLLIERLTQLRDGADPIFESSLAKVADQKQAEEDRINRESAMHAAMDEGMLPDARQTLLNATAKEYGLEFVGWEQLPYKIAEALGVSMLDDETPAKSLTYEAAREKVLAVLLAP